MYNICIIYVYYIYEICVPDQPIDICTTKVWRIGRSWSWVVACWWCIYPASGDSHGFHMDFIWILRAFIKHHLWNIMGIFFVGIFVGFELDQFMICVWNGKDIATFLHDHGMDWDPLYRNRPVFLTHCHGDRNDAPKTSLRIGCRRVTKIGSVWIRILTLLSKRWILQDKMATSPVWGDFSDPNSPAVTIPKCPKRARLPPMASWWSGHRSPGPLKRFASWALEFSQQACWLGCWLGCCCCCCCCCCSCCCCCWWKCWRCWRCWRCCLGKNILTI